MKKSHKFEWSKIYVPAIVSLLTSLIVYIIAPHINWHIDKEILQFENRKEVLHKAREILSNDNLTKQNFRNTVVYSQLKQYLSDITIETVEGKHMTDGINSHEATIIVSGEGRMSGVNPFRNLVLDELADLEKKWELLD